MGNEIKIILIGVITGLILYGIEWIPKLIRYIILKHKNIKPPDITIYGEHLRFRSHAYAGIRKEGNPASFNIPINFINMASLKVHVFYYSLSIQTKEKINGLEFKISPSGGNKFSLEPSGSSEQRELTIYIIPNKDYTWEEIINILKLEESKNNYMIIKFKYKVSNIPEEQRKEIEIKDFFKWQINEIEKMLKRG